MAFLLKPFGKFGLQRHGLLARTFCITRRELSSSSSKVPRIDQRLGANAKNSLGSHGIGTQFRSLGAAVYGHSLFVNLYRQNPLTFVSVRTNKTHSGAKKRFRKTKSGRIKFGRTGTQHLLRKHNRKRNRNLARGGELPQGTKRFKNVRRMLAAY